MKKIIEFWRYYIWKLQIQIRTRPRRDWVKLKQTRRDCLKMFHPRRDNLQNCVRDRDKIESLGTFCLETETLANQCSVPHWIIKQEEVIKRALCKMIVWTMDYRHRSPSWTNNLKLITVNKCVEVAHHFPFNRLLLFLTFISIRDILFFICADQKIEL